MYSSVTMRQKTKQETCNTEEHDSFHDKRRLLSYWKSLDPPTCPLSNTETENGGVKNELFVELKKCLTELDDIDSLSNTVEKDATVLQNEQLSLLKQLGQYSAYLSKENLDFNDNFKSSKKDNEVLDTLKAERKLLLGENENLVKQMEEQKKEHKSSSQEQQRDMEKLTREVQNFNISRRKLQRELLQMTKQKNDNEVTVSSLRQEINTMKASYEAEMQKLSNMNDRVSQENSELVEKGKEATESLKIALHQLTEEKKAMQMQRKPGSSKDIRELEASLERAKKEREAFRQRCEKSEMLQRNLQKEISTLKNDLEVKEKELSTRSAFHKEVVDGADRSSIKMKPTSDDGDDSLMLQDLQRAQSRISQLKQYVHVLEDRIKEKDESILSLRRENSRANDVAMEKSLELSRSRRMLERKIEKLTNENSDLKIKFLIPTSQSRNRENEETRKHQQDGQRQEVQRSHKEIVNSKQRTRRRSNPERSIIETTLERLNDQNPPTDNDNATCTGTTPKSSRNQTEMSEDSGKSTQNVSLDVTPRARRRIGGKFIRESSKRHSADLGRLMSRPEPIINRKSDSDMLREDESGTIFINKYRKKSEDEEHWV